MNYKELSGKPCTFKYAERIIKGYYFNYKNGMWEHYFMNDEVNGGHEKTVEKFNKTFGMDLKYGYCVDTKLEKLSFEINTEDLVNNYEI